MPLGEVADVKDGIIQGAVADLLFIDESNDEFSKKLLFGSDVSRYKIAWSGAYVNYNPDELMQVEIERRGPGVRPGLWMRNAGVFERRKIVTRQTADRIIGAIDEDCMYYANTLHGISVNEQGESCGVTLEYLLAILNSRLMNYIYAILTGEVGKTFAQIKIDTLKKLPICQSTQSSTALELVQVVDRARNSLRDKDTSLSEIDRLVFELYGLTQTEVEYVEQRSNALFGE